MNNTGNLSSTDLIFSILFWVLVYIYYAYCFQVIAKKTKTKDKWMAWIPILNFYLLCKIDARPATWVVLFFVPFVNIFIWTKIWIEIAEELGKPVWIGAMMFFPLLNIIPLGYLAFSSSGVFTGIDR